MRNIRESLAKMARRALASDRYRGSARRIRARAGAAGKPAGVRKGRRHVLTADASARMMSLRGRRVGRELKSRGRRRARRPRRRHAPHAPRHRSRRMADFAGGIHAHARPAIEGASDRPRQPRERLSGKIGRRDRRNTAWRLGQSRARCSGICSYRSPANL